MLQGKRFGSNEEVIAETEAYFEAKDKLTYKHGIEKLEKRWNDCIELEGDCIDEKKWILQNKYCFLSYSRDLLNNVLKQFGLVSDVLLFSLKNFY